MATSKKTTTKAKSTKAAKPLVKAVKKSTTKPSAKSVTAKSVKTSPKTPTPPRVTDSVQANPNNGDSGSILGWLVAVLLGGALLGTFLADSFWMEQFDEDAAMVVIDNKTWMPVEGEPVSVVVLSDKNCGSACDTTGGLDSLRASVTPALMVEEIDVSSARGQALVDRFDLVSIPQYFFGTDIEDFELEGPDGEEVSFIDNLPAGLLTLKDDLYYIDGAQVGFKPGKFIKAPVFADLESEPRRGDGPIQVVEFTDLQCPYCKRFYDQNKALLEQLVDDGTITYVIKDFPLNFHKEATDGMHKALNCSLAEGGNEVYFAVKDQIFANQSSFNGIGGAGAEQQISEYASEQGVDISSCLASSSAEFQAEIKADTAEGAKYGVTGTPSVFVGTQILPGAVGPAVLSAAVEAEKAK